jgi:transcription elongation GreA/GreB family factor
MNRYKRSAAIENARIASTLNCFGDLLEAHASTELNEISEKLSQRRLQQMRTENEEAIKNKSETGIKSTRLKFLHAANPAYKTVSNDI